ncbi:response regulator [Sphingomonas japonica]|uniref:Two-component system KDP operon response regulator KdpE n=1 Tax=Sphingomonas japonica TaxID=511662 RepID=A0ABX0TZF8_9SPHN|nr:response regulator transcription factor [Sphingomonas japonica]NIJ22552.1 two-component system KDP operon response regulator KdpE [Sphingomonas japonica]
MSGPTIMVVDDEPQIRRLCRVALERAEYRVVEAENAAAALGLVDDARPDAVLLDLGLPDRDGLELVPILKRAGVAIVVVSAREATDDKVAALDLGADDYLTKPFDTEELLARIRAALRHRRGGEVGPVRVGALEVDIDRHRVSLGGSEVHLTRKEFDVLAALAQAPGRVVTHRAILEAVWPHSVDRPIEYLRIVVRNLRQKLEADPSAPTRIVNELGIGYRLMDG